ncbi:twin-arginine translocase TatA/TatE family subunit [candidate division KSB1 bacterium]|nr:twin-arginine translocase TatA/TatE family subunit [candidate division KSB1 bacterium]
MFGMGTWEIMVIMVAILLLFGSKRIPEVARGLGKGINELKKAAEDIKKDLKIDDIDRDLRG